MMNLGQARRGQQRIERQFVFAEDAQFAALGLSGADEELERAEGPQAAEVDLVL